MKQKAHENAITRLQEHSLIIDLLEKIVKGIEPTSESISNFLTILKKPDGIRDFAKCLDLQRSKVIPSFAHLIFEGCSSWLQNV